MPNSELQCVSCGEPLTRNGVCAACAFGAMMAREVTTEDSWLAGPDVARFGFPALKQLPMIFGEYELRREIAAGGMGVVYEAWHARARRTVALKMVKGHAMASAAELARFKVEAEAAAQLDHPHIVPIHEIGECEGQPFFTMKLIGGGTLAERLKKERNLPPREAALLLVRVAQAVHHAHQRGVLHRDLKPGNILLDNQGTPFLTDFGLARIGDADSGLTISSAHLGTPNYMSPEQAAGRVREISTASDVWALGVILYQMVSGNQPFPGSSGPEVMRRIIEEEAPGISASRHLSSATHILDRDLITIIARCLEKIPARRMNSALTLAEELQRWLEGQPIRSRPVTGAERFVKWCRRHPGRVAAVLAVGISLIAGSLVSFFQWKRAERERSIAQDNEQKALAYAVAGQHTSYASTLAAALAARERNDFAQARRLLTSAPPPLRGFEWRLLDRFCSGDAIAAFTLPGNQKPETMAWLPDGSKCAVITQNAWLSLRDANGAAASPPRQLPACPEDPLYGALGHHNFSYAPDGRHFAYSYRNTLRVMDANTLEVKMEKQMVLPQSCWLDEHRLLYGFDGIAVQDDAMVSKIFDLRDSSEMKLPNDYCAPLALSADRQTIALTNRSRFCIQVFRAGGLSGPQPLVGVEPAFTCWPQNAERAKVVALSAGGDYLGIVRGSVFAPSRALEVLEVANGKRWVSQSFRDPVTGLSFHQSEPVLVLTNADAVVRLFYYLKEEFAELDTYDDEGPKAIREPLDSNGPHSPPRRLLTRSAQNERAVFLLGHEGRVHCGLFHPNGSELMTASADGTLRRWKAETPRPSPRISDIRATHYGNYPAASVDGRRVLYNSVDGNLCMWREGRGMAILGQRLSPLAVLSDNRFVSMDLDTSDIVLWHGDGTKVKETARIHGPGFIQEFRSVRRGVVSKDGSKIVGATPGQLFVVDLATGTVTASGDLIQQFGATGVCDHAVSPDGKWIAASAFGRRTRIIPVGDLTVTVATLGSDRDYDTALAFHPDGHCLYAGNEDGKIRVWDTSTWEEQTAESWQAHRGAVTALVASHDGKLIVSAGDNGLKIWRTEFSTSDSFRELLSFPTYHAAAWLHFGLADDGTDRALLHIAPWCPLEVWPAEPPPANDPF